jgi:hypothetical protein
MYTLAEFEPGIFCSVDVRDDHYTYHAAGALKLQSTFGQKSRTNLHPTIIDKILSKLLNYIESIVCSSSSNKKHSDKF